MRSIGAAVIGAIVAMAVLMGIAGAQQNAAPRYTAEDCPQLSQAVVVADVIKAQIQNGARAEDECLVVAIRYKYRDSSKPQICTGTIVGRRLILTAGHCACGDPATYTVRFQKDVNVLPKDGQEARIVGLPIVFDQFACSRSEPLFGFDLALLRLDGDIAPLTSGKFGFAADLRFLAWNLRSLMPVGQTLRAVGYGRTETGSIGVKMKADIPIVTPNCTDPRLQSSCAPHLEMVLADTQRTGTARRDSCGGDSGGPIFLDVPQCKVTKSIIVGVTSRAGPFSHNAGSQHCGGGGIYTVLGRYAVHDWLNAHGASAIQC